LSDRHRYHHPVFLSLQSRHQHCQNLPFWWTLYWQSIYSIESENVCYSSSNNLFTRWMKALNSLVHWGWQISMTLSLHHRYMNVKCISSQNVLECSRWSLEPHNIRLSHAIDMWKWKH
jgi:hypothetical protein